MRFKRILMLCMAWMTACAAVVRAGTPMRPNIVFILADDLGYGDVGCQGQRKIRTPNIDRLAGEGMRFTQAYAGGTVCAPSRCALMTGLHTGHCRIRGNSRDPLEAGDRTVAEALKEAGYRTGLIGKWGLGDTGTTGEPRRKGFDYFFGFLDQVAAHNYHPEQVWENGERVELPGNKEGRRGDYVHDLFMERTGAKLKEWAGADGPFFLLLAFTLPHANNERGAATGNGMEIPSDAPYTQEAWPQVEKDFAAMVTRLDESVGTIMRWIEEAGIAKETLVLFTSDNGPHREGGHDAEFFESRGGLRGIKRSLYEGGIRVPAIAAWPGRIKAGSVSDLVWAGWDWPATAAELAGAAWKGGDGRSIVPALLGGEVKERPPLYWEFHEGGFTQAVREGRWKAVRGHAGKPLEIYDLDADPAEQHDLAKVHPEIVERMEARLAEARTPSERWPIRDDWKPRPPAGGR